MKEPIVFSSTAEMLAFSRGKVNSFALTEYKKPSKKKDGEEPKRVKKTKVIRLYGALTSTQRLRVYTKVNGYNRPTTVEMDPGTLYELPDEHILNQMLEKKILVKKPSPSLEQALIESKTPYERKVCKVCGGKTLGIEYPIVEVVTV